MLLFWCRSKHTFSLWNEAKEEEWVELAKRKHCPDGSINFHLFFTPSSLIFFSPQLTLTVHISTCVYILCAEPFLQCTRAQSVNFIPLPVHEHTFRIASHKFVTTSRHTCSLSQWSAMRRRISTFQCIFLGALCVNFSRICHTLPTNTLERWHIHFQTQFKHLW